MREGKELFRNEDCFASETWTHYPPQKKKSSILYGLELLNDFLL